MSLLFYKFLRYNFFWYLHCIIPSLTLVKVKSVKEPRSGIMEGRVLHGLNFKQAIRRLKTSGYSVILAGSSTALKNGGHYEAQKVKHRRNTDNRSRHDLAWGDLCSDIPKTNIWCVQIRQIVEDRIAGGEANQKCRDPGKGKQDIASDAYDAIRYSSR